jgi:hypothetical protein
MDDRIAAFTSPAATGATFLGDGVAAGVDGAERADGADGAAGREGDAPDEPARAGGGGGDEGRCAAGAEADGRGIADRAAGAAAGIPPGRPGCSRLAITSESGVSCRR